LSEVNPAFPLSQGQPVYFVGRKKMKVGKEVRFPGQELPEATTFVNLRSLLQHSYVVCDYKDGEPHYSELSPIARSGIPTMEMMCAKIKAETGVDVPNGTIDRDVRRVYTCLVNGDPLPEADFLTPVEFEPDEKDVVEDALLAVDEKTHLATIRSVLKRAGVDAAKMDKEAALDKVAEILSGV
jgi:hypothetical protein